MSQDLIQLIKKHARRITRAEHSEANLRMFEWLGLDIDDDISNHFRLQSTAFVTPEERVVIIDFRVLLVEFRAAPVNGTGQNHFVNRLELPAMPDQFRRQPIEQIRMRERFAPDAEVTRRGDNAPSEMMLP